MLEVVRSNLLFDYLHRDYISKSALNNLQLHFPLKACSYFEVSLSRSKADTIMHLLV